MNKIIKEYLENVNNEEKNLKDIEYKIIKQKKEKRKILNIVAVILVIIILGTCSPQIYAKIQLNKKYNEYKRRDYVSGKGQIASAYSETVNMDYIYQDNIGIKISSIVLTDDALKIGIDMKLPEDMRIDKKLKNNDAHYQIGYAIYDENKNVYTIFSRFYNDNSNLMSDYTRLLYKELGLKYNPYNIDFKANGGGYSLKETDNEKVSLQIEEKSLEGFPNSKKLYIRLFNIGAIIFGENDNIQNLDFCDSEWNFEIETPDKFIKRETINLTLLDEIPKLKIEKFTVSETGTVLRAQKKDVVETMAAGKDMDNWGEVSDALINITDEDGNIYYPVRGGTTGEKNGFYSMFEIDKDILESTTLYLNMKIGNEEYSSELQVSK